MLGCHFVIAHLGSASASESQDTYRRRGDGDALVENSAYRKDAYIVYEYHSRGKQDAVFKYLRLSEREEKRIDHKRDDYEKRYRPLPRKCAEQSHKRHKYGGRCVDSLRPLLLKIERKITHNANYVQKKSRARL